MGAAIGTASRGTRRQPAFREPNGVGDLLGGLRREQFEWTHRSARSWHSTTGPNDGRNLQLTLAERFGERIHDAWGRSRCPYPLTMMSLASKGDIALRYGRSLVSES